jgi:hypothetical protein
MQVNNKIICSLSLKSRKNSLYLGTVHKKVKGTVQVVGTMTASSDPRLLTAFFVRILFSIKEQIQEQRYMKDPFHVSKL